MHHVCMPDFVTVRIPKTVMAHVEEARQQLMKINPTYAELGISQTTVVRLALEYGLKELVKEQRAAIKRKK